jgi:UDP-glucose 4-epimerase/UDP-glucuronate decarboxylase
MEGLQQGIFNIGADNEIKIKDIADLLMLIMKTDFTLVEKGSPQGSVLRRRPDLGKFEEYFGKQDNINFNLGLKKTFEWYKKEMGL